MLHVHARIAVDGGADEFRTLFGREQCLLGRVRRDRHDEPVDERQTAADEVGVPIRDGIEASRVQRDSWHEYVDAVQVR